MIEYLIFILVAVAIVVAAYFLLKDKDQTVSASYTTIVDSTVIDGKKQFDSNIDLPRSLNDKDGIEFSFTCWVKIDDFSYRYGEPKVIFTKGSPDMSAMCPALLIDGHMNSLLVKLDTFGGTVVVPISNIPAKKWIHVAICVNQQALDIYINGVYYERHTLTQLPKQNPGTVHTGVNGGFEGKIASVMYYPSFLSFLDVRASMANAPKADPNDIGGPLPPYFAQSWWTGN